MKVRFALCRVLSPILTASRLLSLLAVTKMLQFTAFPLLAEQFGDPGFKAYMRLAQAYRSLSRPSSALKPSHPLYGFLFMRG